ncbi:hypothetical protein Poli38472_014623 [Pythium oligandrum]|uniref:EF-hand domain-containing protein n=1 Tax=Pythium oligandrum TaxID=41045 RepID=A0A8K1CJ79_PYTOL|nr:hypothetical protein Poli38472_014623 [Pythium oligandrum]|eukprot:TMW63918.1 hypothetical protein Poli38472_014623 [Pythium oligandrum]
MSVLQASRRRQLTALEQEESRSAFELSTHGNVEMTAKQLRRCLNAMGLATTKEEARAMVYELDYNDTETITLTDFQRIYAFKTAHRTDQDRFNDAIRMLDPSGRGKLDLLGLTRGKEMDLATLHRHIRVYCKDEDTIHDCLEEEDDLSSSVVHCETLAGFLGLEQATNEEI